MSNTAEKKLPKPKGSVTIENDRLLVRFQYNKPRFNIVRNLPGASYNKIEKRWEVPLESLPKLQSSRYFQPPEIDHRYDVPEIAELLSERLEAKAEAVKRITANPFAVHEADIQTTEIDLVFRLDRHGNSLRAFPRFRSRVKRWLEEVPGVHYLRSEKAYFFPSRALGEFVKVLRNRKYTFAIEENAGQRLKESARLRDRFSKGEGFGTAEELKLCLLTPYIMLHFNEHGETFFSENDYTTEQLKDCFPLITPHATRKKLASSMTERDVLSVLYHSRSTPTKVWLTAEVASFLEDRKAIFEELIRREPTGFDDSLLALGEPEIFWLKAPEGSAGLIVRSSIVQGIKDKKHILARTPRELHPQFRDTCFYPVRDSEMLSFYDSVVEVYPDAIPTSALFEKHLAGLRVREKRLARRNYFQNLSDTKLELEEPEIETRLFPHQRVAVAWLLENERALLGDDMGLGKTLSVLTTLAQLRSTGECDFLLVVCPNSLCRNWVRETDQWFPDLRLALLPQTKSKREKFLRNLSRGGADLIDGLVINYETLRIESVYPEIKNLLEQKDALLCCDESQRMKNPQSKTFEAIASIAGATERRVLLSGTPAPKDISDIWAQMFILDEGERFGTNYYEWLTSIAVLGNKWSEFAIRKFIPDQVEETIYRTHEVLLRRRKEDVIDLPAKTFSTRDIVLKGEQLKRYEEVRKDLLLRVTAASGKEFVREISSILEEYLRAVQAASNPRLIDPNWKGEPAKFIELDDIVREVVEERDEKLVIWTNYRLNVEELVARYVRFEARPFSGEVSTEERDKTITEFQSDAKDAPRILVAIPAAGGVGITLTAAQTAVYVDKTWNGEHWLQSVDRVHRIGQTGTVNIISLHASLIDELISRNLLKKEAAQRKLLGDGERIIAEEELPSREELLEAVGKK